MPRSGGIFSLVASYFATAGQTIRTEQHNPVLEDIAEALTGSVARDGSASMVGNLNMNGFRVTGIANGINPQDAMTLAQVPTTFAQSAVQMTGPGILGREAATLGSASVIALGAGAVFDTGAIRLDWATIAEATTGTSEVKAVNPARAVQIVNERAPALVPAIVRTEVNASGAAPIFSIRAWANFDGATGAVRTSGNIASVVRNGVGDYTVTFGTAMPGANYGISLSCSDSATNSAVALISDVSPPTTTALRIKCYNAASAGSIDPTYVTVTIVR